MINRTAMRAAATAAALIVMGLGLTACGGSSADGEYVAAHEDGGALLVATIDGDALHVAVQYCADDGADREDDDPGDGTLNEDQTNVLWSSSAQGNNIHYATDGGYDSSNRSPVTADGETLTIGNVTYSARDSSQGKQIVDTADAACAG